MNLNLYDEQMNRISIIGNQFISCLWSEGYNTTQAFTLELQVTAEYKRKVKPDCFVGRSDRKTLMVIKTVQVQNGKIIATGKQATRCLDDVPFIGTISAGSKMTSSIKEAYESGEGYTSFSFADSTLEDVYRHDISNKSILVLCEKMGQETDVGFRAIRSTGGITVEFYKPEEKDNLVFSERFGNMTVNGITLSTQNWKNYAIVLGAGEGDNRIRQDVDLSEGQQKRSLIIDARDLSMEEGETEENYRLRLTARGIEKMLECQKTWECAFLPLASDFGTRYDLGDILKVYLHDYGITLKARVTRFTQKTQKNKTSTTIEVGNITITR